MKAKWIKAVYILVGVLIPIPATLLAQHFQSLASRTFFKYWFVVAQIILLFVICLFLGAYIAMYKNLKFIGKPGKWRVKWSEFALGAVFFIMGSFMKLVWDLGLYASVSIDSRLLINITFNNSLYIWVLLAGFFMVNSFEKVPSKEEAREETTRAGNETDPSKPE